MKAKSSADSKRAFRKVKAKSVESPEDWFA